MKNYNLNIAGYNIRVETSPTGPDLVPAERFHNSIFSGAGSDILLTVHSGSIDLPPDTERVFHAPYVEEVNGMRIKKSEKFWSIYKHHSDLFINTVFPLSVSDKKGTLRFSLTSREWDLFLEGAGDTADPLEYPLDGLILYYLTVMHGDIMIHASGVNSSGHGYIFSGISGKGKTTMAKLWDQCGAKVIHDDRLIIRNIGGDFRMFNTPVYNNDAPAESLLNRIYIIEHCEENKIEPVKGAAAVSLVIANCIQHNWNPEIIARLMGTVSSMCGVIPTVKLFFRPDRSIIDFMADYE